MFKTIGDKFYSYSFDDTNETTSVQAILQGDDSNGNLKLLIKTDKIGPYLSGGKAKEEKSSNVGTIQKPNLGMIRSQTAKGSNYYGFPAAWHGYNGQDYKNLPVLLFDWSATNMKTEVSDDSKRRQIKDKLEDLTGIELEKIRKMLRLASPIEIGDICTVDESAFNLRTPETVKLLKKIIKEGNGKVEVDDFVFGYGYVFAHNSPISKILGGVKVPKIYLKVIGHKTASDKMIKIAQEMERISTQKRKGEKL